MAELIVTTLPHAGERRVREILGVVSGDAILGANIFRDLFASITDIVGGRSGSYEKELRKAKDLAMQEMEDAAASIGANAVLGVDLDYENIQIANGGNMLMVSASGTAVVLE